QGLQGTIGPNGLKSLFTSANEPAGTNCSTGGRKIQVGIDDNNNGILDATEVDQTFYVCNRSIGPQGIQGTVGTTGATGATGPQGIQGTQGAIGPSGLKSLLTSGNEPAGA